MSATRVILLGPPGAGKGTQARRLAEAAHVPHIATGDMFRAAVIAGTPMGMKAKSYMEAGELVPDDVTIGVVEERLAQPDASAGFVMDGFPRTPQQATALDALLARLGLKINAAIEIKVPRAELVRRLALRFMCGTCGASYGGGSQAATKPGVCDRCGGKLLHRDDDDDDTAAHRIDVYDRQTAPLVEYYRGAGVLTTVDGARPPDKVFEGIAAAAHLVVAGPTS